MNVYDSDVLPIPISYLQRNELGKEFWEFVNPNLPYSGLKDMLDVCSYGPFETKVLKSKEDSFYKALSFYVFGTNEYTDLIHRAILKHAKMNIGLFNDVFLKEEPTNLSANVYEYLKSRVGSGKQASYLDVHVASDLLKTPIFLISPDDPWTGLVSSFVVGQDEKVMNAILLTAEPTEDHSGFYFAPIISYQRSQSMAAVMVEYDTDDSADETSIQPRKYSIVLLDVEKQERLVVAYATAKKESENLAEFCDEVLETNLSSKALYRLGFFFKTETHRLKMQLDHELFQFAQFWQISSLIDEIQALWHDSSLKDLMVFANHLSFTEYSKLYDCLKSKMYRASFDELKRLRIRPVTTAHRQLNEFLSYLLVCKETSQSISLRYKPPHIIINLDNKSPYFASYYNGSHWCSLNLPDSVKESLPYLQNNTFSVSEGKLVFIKDKHTLGTISLFNNYKNEISYSRIPDGVAKPRLAATTDSKIILLMSDETNRMISVVQVNEVTDINPWQKIDASEHNFTFLGKVGIFYNIGKHKCILKAATNPNQNAIMSIWEDGQTTKVYNYDVGNTDQIQHSPQFTTIPIPAKQTGQYIAVSTQTLMNHLSECYKL